MTTEEIHIICGIFLIKKFSINDDFSIDVDGDVNLSNRMMTSFPLHFRNVSGCFDCSQNNLTSLYGCPVSVGTYFDCSRNNLTSLEYSPNYVGGNFYFYNNNIDSFKGICINIKKENLALTFELTYDDYYKYCTQTIRDLKFKKILK